MKKTIYLFMLSLFLGLFVNAQYLINQGADININAGSSLVIDGDFENQLDGRVGNSGDILITGNWTNNQTSGTLLQGTSGTVRMVGTTVQTITGTAFTYFSHLDLQNNAMLGGIGILVYSSLQLAGTYLSLGNSNLIMSFGSPILGANASAYIITNGTGKLRQQVGASNKLFPIGTSSDYTPIILSNAGTLDYYSIGVFPDVRTNGLTGVTIPEINDCVDMTWDITENTAGGSNLTITPSWGAALEGPSFNRYQSGIGHYTGGAWDPQEITPVSGTNPYWITRSGITSIGAFAVGDLESPMAKDIRVDITVLLGGPYNTSTNLMNLDLNPYIPNGQPYDPPLPYYLNWTPKWLYGGGEFAPTIPTDAVDWVIVQLRDATSPFLATSATILETQAAFVLDDGSVVGLNGTSLLSFTVPYVNDLYAVVYHRNHLGVISNFPLTSVGGVYTHDFTAGEFQAYGGNLGHMELEPGVWGMVAADGDGNGTVQLSDKNVSWTWDLGFSGYRGGDFDMNGIGQLSDKNTQWKNGLGAGNQVPAKKAPFTGYQSQIPE